jgi:hypothetical protein
MRKIFTLLCVLSFLFSAKSQLLTENFSYTSGQLLTANGWTAHSGAGTNALTVTSSGLTYTGHPGSGVGNAAAMTTSGEDANKTFTAITSGSAYMSFLVKVSAAQAAGDYFIGLLTSTSSFPIRLYAKSDGAGGFFFGVGKNAGTVVYETTPRILGTTYFVVTNYVFNNGTTTDDAVNIWVNPALGGSEPAATIANVTGANTDVTTIGAVYLRQGTAANAATLQVDAILAGTTWASVTPGGAPTPTLSASTLTSYGNVCTNTTAGPNSFTITGTNLSTTNVDVAALAGFTYSTTSGGTYTTSLSLTQPGGAYSQEVFVKFDPTAVQSYNGNIVLSGGGASSINVAAAGSGVNTMASVTSGSASAITQTTATVAGTITANGCSAVTAYGIEYSTTSGFANGTGTQVPSTNIAGGNFSFDLTTLATGTTYYYKAYATNAGGTAYGTELSFTTATANPTINTTTLTSFGNVCINTTAGPSSFTISGANLTTADVTVAALPGFTFSTTSGGTYTASLSLTQPGGTYNQDIYVRFTPSAVQSYNGNIVVDGGGVSAPVNVAAVGAGVNTKATVTTGASSAITQTTATLAGNISANGCSAVTAYGIEYSTTNGFADGAGTQVASTNNAGGNYTAALSGLTASTTYYYKAYATNAGGTAYGTQQSFTTASPTLTATALTGFGNVCVNATAGPNSFTITGVGLNNSNVTVGALTGYTYSTTAGGPYTPTLSLTQPGGAYSQVIYVRFLPIAVQSYNGNIPVSGGGAIVTANIAATGSGINTTPTVITNAASNIFTHYATLAGSITANGCSNVTAYGFEFSGINGFADGTGAVVAANNLNAGAFSATLNNLVQGATYYYKAWAVNAGGKSYGTQQTFTVTAVPNDFTVFPVPAAPGSEIRISIKNITPGYYGLQFINSNGGLAFQYNMNVQADFINQAITIPGTLARGVYQLQLVNTDGVVAKKTILVH